MVANVLVDLLYAELDPRVAFGSRADMSTPAVVLEAARGRRRRFAANNPLSVVCALIIGIAVFLAAFGPLLAPHDPDAASLANAYVGPVPGHPLGYDSQGRDLLSRLLTGARRRWPGRSSSSPWRWSPGRGSRSRRRGPGGG